MDIQVILLLFFVLSMGNAQYYGSYGSGLNSYYPQNRCYNYCGYYGAMSPYGQNYGAIARPYGFSGLLSPYAYNTGGNIYDQSLNSGSYGLPPYAAPLRPDQCRDRSFECISMAQTGQCSSNPQIRSLCPQSCAVPQCLDGFGMGGSGIMDTLSLGTTGAGGSYGSGYNSGLYSSSVLPFQRPSIFDSPFNSNLMNQQPFLLGPDGSPFMGDLMNPPLLPRPMNIFDEGNIFGSPFGSSPFSAPFRKPANPNGRSIISATSGQPGNMLSLDDLINQMDNTRNKRV
ncbi:hypothetical protein M3Y98_01181600 [Aphelenchoides besseyi]|nr:hypothetical protein M3Y98_01181600 [Aphelenchoides besseyi]